jgi:hypothetical protein
VLVERAASPAVFRTLLLVGLVLRIAGLPFRGTDDMDVWKLWTYAGSTSVSTMYGVGGDPPERAVLVWGRRSGTVEYPPASLLALAGVGRVYRAIFPAYPDDARLNVAVKLSILAGDVALCAVLWRLLRRYSVQAARAGVLFYWLNPAAILDGAFLGYLDPWLGALTLLALLALERGAYGWCGAALALTALTKLQIALILPIFAVAVVVRNGRGWWKPALAAVGAAAVTTALVVAPFVRAGATANMIQGAGRAFHHDMLSAEAANVWWILTWILRSAWTGPVFILGISRAEALGFPSPRLLGTALALTVMLWAIWRARAATLPLLAAAGACAMHAYTMFSVQVHENHLYLALPLMAVAGTLLPRLRAPYALASAVCALNLYLFQGLGKDFALPPRNATIVDATVLLAFVNIAALVWHARRYSEVTSEEGASPAAVHLNGNAADVRRGG